MKVNKESLVKLIELVVRKEIKSAVNEIKQAVETSVVNEQSGKPTTSIKQALEETYESRQDWPSVNGDKPYDSARMGEILNKQYSDIGIAGQMAAQQSDIATQTATEENVSVDAIPEALKNALNKDYSDLVKRFDK
tara:strand:- start:2956 stop:3363 length:408 start_codon:yes stop_codon:yes gene_type:complete